MALGWSSQGGFPDRQGDSRDELAPQPAEPAGLGAVLAATRGSAALSQGVRALPEQWSLSRRGDVCPVSLEGHQV